MMTPPAEPAAKKPVAKVAPGRRLHEHQRLSESS
jgi:hypothetical protein